MNLLLVVGALFCAFQAIRSRRLLYSALWLAALSAITAILIYGMGAAEVAVIELSVGAGLVTVLFVFAISIAGDDPVNVRAIVPKSLAWSLVILAALALIWLTLPLYPAPAVVEPSSFQSVLWVHRELDVLVQIVLIFAGVVGVAGVLGDSPLGESPKEKTTKIRFERSESNVEENLEAADYVETRAPSAASNDMLGIDFITHSAIKGQIAVETGKLV